MRHGKPHTPELIDLQREQSDVCDGNWIQGRYYGDEGKRVRDMLSFNAVFDIHPFEVGVNRRAERRMHREKLGALTGILGLGGTYEQKIPEPFQRRNAARPLREDTFEESAPPCARLADGRT